MYVAAVNDLFLDFKVSECISEGEHLLSNEV